MQTSSSWKSGSSVRDVLFWFSKQFRHFGNSILDRFRLNAVVSYHMSFSEKYQFAIKPGWFCNVSLWIRR
jgi:hypothetical protein